MTTVRWPKSIEARLDLIEEMLWVLIQSTPNMVPVGEIFRLQRKRGKTDE